MPLAADRENLAVTKIFPAGHAPVGADALTVIESVRLSRQLTPSAMRHSGFLPAQPSPAFTLTKRRNMRRPEALPLSPFQK
jgi:hypothetical protein